MTMNDGERELRDFVLRKLADEDRERIEEALFANDETFERLVEAEYDLIDEWARGVLPLDQKREVESIIGSDPRGAERLRVAKTLGALASQAAVVPIASFRRRSATWLPVAAAAGVAVVVAGLWFASSQTTSPASPSERIAQQPTPSIVDAPAPVDAPALPPVQIAEAPAVTDSTVVERQLDVPREPLSLMLSLATLRSESAEPVLSVAGSQPVEITVALDPADRFDAYAISLSGPGGNVIYTDDSVQPTTADGTLQVTTSVETDQLQEGLHEIAVSADGIDLGWVTFRVEK